MNRDSTRSNSSVDDLVPRQFDPARAYAPRPVRTVRGLLALPAMVLLWVIPKTVGPYLAAAGWRAAISAHVVSMVLGVGLLCWAQSPYRLSPFPWKTVQFGSTESVPVRASLTWSEWARGPLAALVIEARFGPTGALGSANPALLLAVLEGLVACAAVLMMPYHAAGERGRTLFGRCLRLSLWSTSIAIPVGIGCLIGPVVLPWLGLTPGENPIQAAMLSLAGLWWLMVLLRSGYRYAGPAVGPGWTPRTARCEGCGYIITGLPKSTNCPECGRPVAESLPERRAVPAFVTARGWWASLKAFAETERETKRGPEFFAHLAVRRDHGRDRTFFLAYGFVLLAIVLLFAAFLAAAGVARHPVENVAWGDDEVILLSSRLVCAAALMFGGQIVLAGLLAAIVAAAGRRDIRASAIVAFYAVATSLAPIVGIGILTVLAVGIVGGTLDDVGVSGLYLYLPPAAVGALGVAWMIVVVAKRLRHAFRETRLANA